MLYVLLVLIFLNTPLSSVHVSTYYQIITLLNTKGNVVVLYSIYAAIILGYFHRNNKLFWVDLMLLLMFVSYDTFAGNNVHYFTFMGYYGNNLNTNLINGIVLIHPIFLYTFYALLFVKIWLCYVNCTEVFLKNYKQHNTYLSTAITFYPVALILAALILGCWWAEQELSWGGWWSWDFVELVALNFLIIYLGKVHHYKHQSNASLYSEPVQPLMVIVVSVMVVRFNIINSVHNFVNLESQNQYMYYVVLVLVVLNVLIILNGCFYQSREVKERVTPPNKLFMFLYFFFFFLFVVNVASINLLNICSDVNKNVQNVYLYTIMLAIVVSTIFVKVYKPTVVIIVVFVTFYAEVIVVDYLVLLSIVSYIVYVGMSNTTTNNTLKVAIIHVSMLIFLLVVIYQIFLFGNNVDVTTLYQIMSFKLNSCIKIFNSTTLHHFVESNSYQVTNNKEGVDMFSIAMSGSASSIAGFFKNIFEKDALMSCFFVTEVYSYNLQALTQINTAVFLLLPTVVLSFFLIVTCKRAHKLLFI